MKEMGASTLGSSWAAAIDRTMLYRMRCVAKFKPRRSHTDSCYN